MRLVGIHSTTTRLRWFPYSSACWGPEPFMESPGEQVSLFLYVWIRQGNHQLFYSDRLDRGNSAQDVESSNTSGS